METLIKKLKAGGKTGTLCTVLHRGRNTKLKSPPSSIDARYRNWSITINNYTEAHIKKWLTTEGEYIFQEEKGELTGTPHLQGFHMFKNPKNFNQVKEIFPTAHIENVRNIQAIKNYCSKEETRNGRRYCNVSRWKINGAINVNGGEAKSDPGNVTNLELYLGLRIQLRFARGREEWGRVEELEKICNKLYDDLKKNNMEYLVKEW